MPMGEWMLLILLIALVLDWKFGEPEILWSRITHPIVLFGKAVSFADKQLNIESDADSTQYKKGAMAICLLILLALLVGLALGWVIELVGWLGLFIELFIVFVLLAQKSLADHVGAVAVGLRENGLEGGRAAVGMIVGRDPDTLNQSGVCRAAIESLAENFSDGVVAPAFWYAVFGLPGIIVYKMINTADSMIAYKNEKYLWFGRVAAQIDDLANWVPARLSALLIAMGGASAHALKVAFQDAGLHRSPNAGWPEAAMAGASGLALGGPRVYSYETVQQAWLNGAGKRELAAQDIEATLWIFNKSCFALWAIVLALLILV